VSNEVETIRRPNAFEVAVRQRKLLLKGVQYLFIVAFLTMTILNILGVSPNQDAAASNAARAQWPLTLGVAIFIGLAVILVDRMTPQKNLSTIISIFLGLLAAMLATLGIGYMLDLLVTVYDIQAPSLVFFTKVVTGLALAYLCISTVLETQDDFRLVIPYVEFAKQIRGPRPLMLDTSALIDGRIADLAATGIIQAPIIIPGFVIGELQTLSDSTDRLKRARGRRGLDLIGRLQRSPTLDVSIDESPIPGKAVDQMLVESAKRTPATIVTADMGLSRVAGIQGVTVLNLNDVANSLKPAVIPGEGLHVRLIKPGEQRGQGVGYLDDGTMVVAEDGAEFIGEDVDLVVTSTLQTSAGRLIFGRVGRDEGRSEAPVRMEVAQAESVAPEAESETDEQRGPRPGPYPPNRPNPRAPRTRNPRRT
jgi:uncharacterized protein YacL